MNNSCTQKDKQCRKLYTNCSECEDLIGNQVPKRKHSPVIRYTIQDNKLMYLSLKIHKKLKS